MNPWVCVAPLNYTSEVKNSDGAVKITRPFDAKLIAKLPLSLNNICHNRADTITSMSPHAHLKV